MSEQEPKKLFIFAVQSYGAMTSFDGGATDIELDQEATMVGHQYADSLDEALQAMAEEIASDHLDTEKPDFYDKEDATDEEENEITKYDDLLDDIKRELEHFELVMGGQHSTLFLN